MTLKKSISVAAIVITLLVMTMSCEDSTPVKNSQQPAANSQTNSANGRVTNYTFDGTEGGAISLDVASRWIANYATKNPQGVRSHFFGTTILKKILARSGAMGIRIYYSLNDSGMQELFLIGADGNGNDLSSANDIKGIVSAAGLLGSNLDTFQGTEGDSISANLSKHWMTNYTNNNPSGLIAHFFGNEIINQLLAQSGCSGIRIYYALNDSGVQQLLLVGANNKGENILPGGVSGGRVTDDGTIADMSFPCPTHCSGT